MKRKIAIGLVLTLVIAVIPLMPNAVIAQDEQLVVDLIADGGHAEELGDGYDGEDVGDVIVWNDESNLYITYVVYDPWVITETHLHVALNMGAIPEKEGNPISGEFDYKGEYDPPVIDVTYTYLLGDWGWETGTVLYIAAHAIVEKPDSKSVSAWGHGFEYPGDNWATYFEYTIQEGWSEPPA